jgi:predicted nuclease with TOPRIM domain
LDYQRDGTLLYNAASLASAKSQGLRDKLLSGLRIGYSSSTDNLADLLKSQMSSIGVLTNQTSSGADSLSSLNKEKDRLEERLNKIPAGTLTDEQKKTFETLKASQITNSTLVTNIQTEKDELKRLESTKSDRKRVILLKLDKVDGNESWFYNDEKLDPALKAKYEAENKSSIENLKLQISENLTKMAELKKENNSLSEKMNELIEILEKDHSHKISLHEKLQTLINGVKDNLQINREV